MTEQEIRDSERDAIKALVQQLINNTDKTIFDPEEGNLDKAVAEIAKEAFVMVAGAIHRDEHRAVANDPPR